MKSQSIKIEVKADMGPIAAQLDAAADHLSHIADAYRTAATNLRAGAVSLPVEEQQP